MPNTRAGRDSSSDANVDNSINDDNTNAIALKFIELLNDEQVLAKIKIALYPRDLVNKIDLLSAMVNKLSGQLEQKEQRISQLEQKVQLLELQADGVEQYSRRANLRLYGIPEDENGENTDAKVLEVVNERMRIHPPIQQNDIERSHRLGPKTDRQGQRRSRSIIVRFASERTRDGVYRARFKLKNFNTNHAPIFRRPHRYEIRYSCRSQTAKEEQEDTRHVDCCRQHTGKNTSRHHCANQVES